MSVFKVTANPEEDAGIFFSIMEKREFTFQNSEGDRSDLNFKETTLAAV